jgi:triacylglycerol esterase/lipase EstA (alpha/beta hydrolase family)
VGIGPLAEQLHAAAEAVLQDSGSGQVDLVGFSMGALVARASLPPLTGKVRRFVSISGPHSGSWLAYLARHSGAVDMRPGSALIRSLEAEHRRFGVERVYCFRTPFDLMVFPTKSAYLPGAVNRTFPVLLHPWMLSSRRVLDAVAEALLAH